LPNPFPGLRPFKTDEAYLFFGREGQIDEVLGKMEKHRFVSILGTSGSGKSSFMYCGLIPSLHGGFMTEAGSNWQVVTMRPGNAPIANLAESIARSSLNNNPTENDLFITKSVNQAVLQSSSLGLVELISQNRNEADENILILVDQFEEIFRFQEARNEAYANERLAFIKLLTNAVEQTKLPIYIVMTMRSDFIGDCAKFPQFTSLINDSHYLIPQMTRDQKRTAILGPVAVGGGNMTSRLVQQLLNDLGDNTDQLPILQHALMRTWDYWTKYETESNPIDIFHYEAIGGMEEALSQHANEAYAELTDEQQQLCERVFKCLTQKGEDGRGIRRPTPLHEIAAVSKSTEEEVLAVIDRFRMQGRTLLTPPLNQQVDFNTVIDISHESLMRIWETLRDWVQEESDSVKMYLRLAEAGAMYQVGRTGLWRNPELAVAIAWQENQQPTYAWAQRNDVSFERAMGFLEDSKEAFNKEQRAKLRAQKNRTRRNKFFAGVLAIATIISIGFWVYAGLQATKAQENLAKAEKETIRANKQAEFAKNETIRAEGSAASAREAAENAKNSEERAKLKEKEALEALELARVSEEEAKKQERLANENARLAKDAQNASEKDKQRAEENAKLASDEREKAEKAAKEAERLRYKALAQTLAIKSLQLRDTSLKAKVALQSYQFNSEYNDNELNPDIYSGLHYSQKLLEGSEFNSFIEIDNESGLPKNAGNKNVIRSLGIKGKMLYSLSSDGNVKVWDIENRGLLENYKLNDNTTEKTQIKKYARSLLNTSNGKTYVGLSNGEIKTLNSETPVYIHPNPVMGMIESDGHLLSWSWLPASKTQEGEMNQLSLSALETGASNSLTITEDIGYIKQFQLVDGASYALAVSNSRGFTRVLKWDNFDNPPEIILEEKGVIGTTFAISQTQNRIIVGYQSGRMNLFNLETRKLIQNMTGHYAGISLLKFSPDSKLLVSGSLDNTARVWNILNPNNPLIYLNDHESWVWSAVFSENSQELFLGLSDGTLKKYPLNTTSVAKKINQKATEKLSKREWEQFVGKDIPYPY
jgi:WD40 repeat protein